MNQWGGKQNTHPLPVSTLHGSGKLFCKTLCSGIKAAGGCFWWQGIVKLIMCLWLCYCFSFAYKSELGWGTLLLCVHPECHKARLPGSCELQKPGALTARVIFSSGTAFVCLKTNRGIREMEEEKINCNKMIACYQAFYPLLEAQLIPAPHSSLSPASLMARATFGENSPACVRALAALLWGRQAEQTVLSGAILPVTLRCAYSKYLLCQFKTPTLHCLINCKSCLLLPIHECLDAVL